MVTKSNTKPKTTGTKKTTKTSTKSKSRTSKKSKIISTTSYKGASIDIVEGKVTPSLEVNNVTVTVARDADTGFYSTTDMPYARFSTLEETGKAVVDNE